MPVSQDRLKDIKKECGDRASWALWKDKNEKGKEKSNMGDTTIFDTSSDLLNPNIVFVGLNISKKIEIPFANFHSTSPRANDYKIRYALKDTPLWGGYMTDIIKDYEEKASGTVMKYVKNNPEFLQQNIKSFEEELQFIGSNQPIIIAFGNDCYDLLKKNLKCADKVYKISHYSYTCITKEKLKEQIKELCISLNI